MGSYDTEIRVSTKVDTSQMQKLQIQIDRAVDKVDSLTKKYDELKNKKIPTQEYKKLQEELSAAQKEMEKLKAQDGKLANLNVEIRKLSQSSAEYAAKMKEIAEQKIPTEAYETIQKQIDAYDKKIGALIDKQERFLATGGKEKDSAYKRMAYDAEKLQERITDLENHAQHLVDTGKAFTLGTDTEQYKNISSKYESVNQELEKQKGIHSEIARKQAESVQKVIELRTQVNQLVEEGKAFTLGSNEEINSVFKELERAKAELRVLITKQDELRGKSVNVSNGLKKIGSAAKKAFGEVSAGAKKSNASLLGGLKIILKYALGIRSLYILFSKIRTWIKNSFVNLMNYSDSFANSIQSVKNSMSTLGNQFAAAFSPIVQMVIPWLTQLISVISTAMTYVAQFIAILGGKSTFTRAKQVQDSYNKSLGNTAKAADKARGALAKFDDLDVLEKKQEDTGAGGGTDAVGDMFEEVPVDSKFKDWLDGILEKIKPILDYFDKLKDIFMEGFWDGLGDWEYRLEIIKNALASIKESLIDIFTDPAVLAAADVWAQSVAYMLGSLVGSITSIGLTIAANLLGGIAEYLEQNKDRIKEYLVSMFNVQTEVNYMLADFFQSFAYVFEAFASEQGQQLTANLIGMFADAFMGVTELVSKLARDILNIFIQPFVENKEAFRTALEGFLGILAEVTGTIKQSIDNTFDKLNALYDSHFKPFFDSIAQGLSNLTGRFLYFWNGKVQPILDQWAAKFDVLWSSHIQPFINSFIELLGSVANLLKALWEQALQPLIEWIIDNVLPVLLPIFEAIYDTIVTVVGDVADFLSGFIDTIKSIIDTIVSLINGDWKGAWENAKSIFENAFNTILSFTQAIWDSLWSVIDVALQTILGAIQVTLLGILDFITGIWNGICDATIEIWTLIVEWLTENFTSFHEFLIYILESIFSFFSETWENITLVFQTFIDFINDTIIPIWQESWDMASSLFQSFHDLIERLIKAIAEFFKGLMKTVKLLIDGDWKGAWENAKKIFTTFKENVDEIIKTVREIIQSFFDWAMGLIDSILSKIGEVGSAISGIFSGGGGGGSDGGGGSVSFAMARTAAYNLEGIPALASGAVLRGGDPFMAILNEQPRGQTNVEAPLDTIKQAVREEMSGMNFGAGNISADMTLDGETFARLLVPYILDEMSRQGYDVDILGVT